MELKEWPVLVERLSEDQLRKRIAEKLSELGHQDWIRIIPVDDLTVQCHYDGRGVHVRVLKNGAVVKRDKASNEAVRQCLIILLSDLDNLANDPEVKRSLSRSKIILWVSILSSAVIGITSTVNLLKKCQPSSDGTHGDKLEQVSPVRAKTPFATVLALSVPVEKSETHTVADDYLYPRAVSDRLFGGKLRFMGLQAGNDGANTLRFGLVAPESGFDDKISSKAGKVHALPMEEIVQILHAQADYQALGRWVIRLYKEKLNVTLDPGRLHFKVHDSSLEIKYENATDETGFVEVIKPNPHGDVMKNTKKMASFDLTDKRGHLMYPAGVPEMYGLDVPAAFMEDDPEMELSLPMNIKLKVRASEIADAINKHHKADSAKIYCEGCTEAMSYWPLVPEIKPYENDPKVRELLSLLFSAKGATTDQQKIRAMYEFAQSLPYIWENDSDMTRPPLVTLFNDGGDCNNVTGLFASLMTNAGYDSGVFHLYPKDKRQPYTHTLGGIPHKYFPQSSSYGDPGLRHVPDRWVPIELTSKSLPGDSVISGKEWDILTIEPVRP